jgi:hypothetical protein
MLLQRLAQIWPIVPHIAHISAHRPRLLVTLLHICAARSLRNFEPSLFSEWQTIPQRSFCRSVDKESFEVAKL